MFLLPPKVLVKLEKSLARRKKKYIHVYPFSACHVSSTYFCFICFFCDGYKTSHRTSCSFYFVSLESFGQFRCMYAALQTNAVIIDAQRTQKGPYAICGQRRPWSACTLAQADLGLRCSLTESLDTVVYVDEQRVSVLDCTDAHADLDLRCPQNA